MSPRTGSMPGYGAFTLIGSGLKTSRTHTSYRISEPFTCLRTATGSRLSARSDAMSAANRTIAKCSETRRRGLLTLDLFQLITL